MTHPSGDGGDDDYRVGYRKPPKHTRFQPGRSGNPKGRPKGTKNLKTDLLEELAERILVREGPRAKRVTKQRAMVKALVAESMKGKIRAAVQTFSMIRQFIDTGETDPDAPPKTFADLIRRAAEHDRRNRSAEQEVEPPVDGMREHGANTPATPGSSRPEPSSPHVRKTSDRED